MAGVTPPPRSEPPPPVYAPPAKKTNPVMIVAIVLAAGFCLCVPILAAILFPVFSQAREAAKQTACLSNLRMMSVGHLMYASDYDDTLHPGPDWATAIAAYSRSSAGCPNFEGGIGYAFDVDAAGVNLAKLEEPILMMYESDAPGPSPVADIDTIPDPPRHRVRGGGVNVSYSDGSAEFYSEEE
jgi:hypothetical protein